MSSIIKIKRSETAGNPAVLGAGELAYSALADNGANGGDRLYIGSGTETAGNAVNHVVIGGKYFTDKLDHTPGVLTASSAIIVDSNSKLDIFNVDNLQFNGSTISSTDTNGNIVILPNGTGSISLDGQLWPQADGGANQFLKTDGAGQLSWAAIPSGSFNIAGNTGTDTFTTGDTLTFTGTTPINTVVSADTVTISVSDASTTSKGVASFSSDNFAVTAGVVTIKDAGIANAELVNSSVIVGTTAISLGGSATTLAGLASVTSTSFTGALTGNADTATSAGKWTTARTLTLGGDLTGNVSIDGSADVTLTTALAPEAVQDIVGAMVSGAGATQNGISVGYDDTNGKLTFDVADPTITLDGDVSGSATLTNLGSATLSVTLDTVNSNTGSFGSSSQVPVVTVNGKGLVTAVTTATIPSSFVVAANTGTADTVNLTETLTFEGGTGVATTVTDNKVSFAIGQSVATTDNVTFNSVTVNGTLTSDDITGTNISIAGNATITGNLTVQGTTTTVNSTDVAISDLNVTLAKDAATATEANGAGITVAGAAATITYTSANDRWNLNKDLVVTNLYGNASTASALQTARSITAAGDASWSVSFSGASDVSSALTLATVNSNTGSFGNSVTVPNFTVNAKGLITAAGSAAIPTASTSVLGLASFSSTNFSVAAGAVTISTVDGGTY